MKFLVCLLEKDRN